MQPRVRRGKKLKNISGGRFDADGDCELLNNNRNFERAVKHWIIAAKLGVEESIEMLMKAVKDGFIRKEVLTATLRAHQTTVDATKSPQRKETENFLGSVGLM